jgi:hypothetical protein
MGFWNWVVGSNPAKKTNIMVIPSSGRILSLPVQSTTGLSAYPANWQVSAPSGRRVGILPVYDVGINDRKSFRAQCYEMLRSRFNHFFNDQYPSTTVLDLRPCDVGLTSWETPELKAQKWTKWVDYSLQPPKMVAIYKILQLSSKPKVSEMRVMSGASIMGEYGLEPCYAGLPILDNLRRLALSPDAKEVMERLTGEAIRESIIGTIMEGYLTEPVIFDPQQTMRVSLMSYEDTPGDHLVLGGFVIEPSGMRVV